jgi:MarR family transcriptional regulator, transcriptional regulator for hemolysin
MPAKNNPDALGFLLTDTARLIRSAFERQVADSGLGITPGEARALSHVAANEGAHQAAIAERMGIEPMTLGTYIDRLEKLGLVTRTPDPQDRRAKQVCTTDAADAMIAAIRRESGQIYDLAQAGLDEAERAALTTALKLIRQNLTAATERARAVRHMVAEVPA